MKLIPLSDVLKAMDSKQIIRSITFVTANRKKGTGGEIITLKNVVQTGNYNTGSGGGNKGKAADRLPMDRNPQHFKNQTRNLMLSGSAQIRKCHIRLITQFNGMQVIW